MDDLSQLQTRLEEAEKLNLPLKDLKESYNTVKELQARIIAVSRCKLLSKTISKLVKLFICDDGCNGPSIRNHISDFIIDLMVFIANFMHVQYMNA